MAWLPPARDQFAMAAGMLRQNHPTGRLHAMPQSVVRNIAS